MNPLEAPDSPTEQWAAHAARLVVDEGLDYASARRKAARQLGRQAGGRVEAPRDERIEAHVREELALFHADTQPRELAALRQLALRWMERLAEWNPHLGGAAWRGTATARSTLRLDLYGDDMKAVEIALIDRGVPYEAVDSGGPDADPVLALHDVIDGLPQPVPLLLHLQPSDAIRGALKPDAQGRSWRGDRKALLALLERADDAAAEATGPGAPR